MSHVYYMNRCIGLAKLGAGFVAPNPMVGSVLVHNEKIIGEGFHQKFGGPHAEVHCIRSVKEEHKILISQSTLYVSLEPCSYFGKTPPCTDLIIQNKISKVVIGCLDPNREVNGKGIEKLKAAGVEVEFGIHENECKNLNRRFIKFQTKQRPYVILKWAQTADGKMAASPSEGKASPNPSQGGALESSKGKESFTQSVSKVPPCGGFREASRLLISNEYTNRLVHRWRSEEASILVGTNTAMMDDPELTTRLWPGPSPVRMVLDMNLSLPSDLKLFNQQVRTVIFNAVKHDETGGLVYYKIKKEGSLIQQIMNALYKLNILSVIVEGGAKLIQSFLDEGIWDEARVISNKQLAIDKGLAAPQLMNGFKIDEINFLTDEIKIYTRNNS
jgi:diaminohydroxyphosphoribosylaminopyrimidine deaminase / 5-amino-6-(5-phosphoribosylamino)uracil reductase